jgi:outer membrane immunogenic protein
MRKLFHTTAALSMLLASMAANAADVPPSPPVYTPPIYAPPPLFSWTGFYVGGNFGGAWRQGNVNDSLFGLISATQTTTVHSSEEANSVSITSSAVS